MKKQMMIITLGILMLVGAVAEEIYAGDAILINLSESYEYYTITENSTQIDLNLTRIGVSVIIIIGRYQQSDNFTITFYNRRDKIITQVGSGGGGGSSCKYNKYYDWECNDWSECIGETQIRTCKEKNNCGNTFGRPNVTRSCILIEDDIPVENDTIIVDEIQDTEEDDMFFEIILVLVIIFLYLCYISRKRIFEGLKYIL